MQPPGESTIRVKRRMIVGNPRFQVIRSIDVVRLIAIGACWGIAFVGFGLLIGSKFRKG